MAVKKRAAPKRAVKKKVPVKAKVTTPKQKAKIAEARSQLREARGDFGNANKRLRQAKADAKPYNDEVKVFERQRNAHKRRVDSILAMVAKLKG